MIVLYRSTLLSSDAGDFLPMTQYKSFTFRSICFLFLAKCCATLACTYAIQLWGKASASTSNTHILERFQSKALRLIAAAPWFMPNAVIRRDLKTPAVKVEIYRVRLSVHPIDLVVNLMAQPNKRRLRRHLPNDMPTLS
jgi:hypothetical protein